MQILITGGSGLIGRRFIQRYPQYRYTVLSRQPQTAATALPPDLKIIGSLTQLTNLDQFDAVINLAGEPIAERRWHGVQKRRIEQSRWQTTRDLIQLMRQGTRPPAVFLSGSAIGYYGHSEDRCLSEFDRAVRDDFATNLCQEWEQVATLAEPQSRLVLLRTGIVLDAQLGALTKIRPPFALGLGAKLGSGRQFMSWIHIADMVDAMHFLLVNTNASGPFNMTAPNPVRNIEFTNKLAGQFNKRAMLTLPSCLLRLLMGESASLLLDSQRVLPLRLTELGFQFSYATLASALSQLFDANKRFTALPKQDTAPPLPCRGCTAICPYYGSCKNRLWRLNAQLGVIPSDT